MSRFGLRVEYTLNWNSQWHVGSGYGSTSVDRSVRRRKIAGRDWPYVPGSQIKGVLRQSCEQLLATLGGQVVDVHGADSDANDRLVESFRPVAESPLLVDRLFGSRYGGECLYFSNAEPKSSLQTVLPVTMRNSIDRATGTAASQKLFSTEIVPKDWTVLTGEIDGHHDNRQLTASSSDFPYEYSLLIASLAMLSSLGGDRSVGRGEVAVSFNAIRWRSPTKTAWHDISTEAALNPLGEDNDLADLITITRDES